LEGCFTKEKPTDQNYCDGIGKSREAIPLSERKNLYKSNSLLSSDTKSVFETICLTRKIDSYGYEDYSLLPLYSIEILPLNR
jgi:hypothetical protein